MINIYFERTSCGRCGGTGQYHVSSAAGAVKGICYKCSGKGYVLSRRGIYARSQLRKLYGEWGVPRGGMPQLTDEQIERLKGIKGMRVEEVEV